MRKSLLRISLVIFICASSLACKEGGVRNDVKNEPVELAKQDMKPLIVIDGVVTAGRIAEPTKVQIAHVSYKKATDALVQEYGSKARAGVLFIITRKRG